MSAIDVEGSDTAAAKQRGRYAWNKGKTLSQPENPGKMIICLKAAKNSITLLATKSEKFLHLGSK